MIFQDNIIGVIIGSVISTAGAILVWVGIEVLKYFWVKRKDNRKFNRLYNLFGKNKYEPLMSIEIANLIDQIGVNKFLKVLRMSQRHDYFDHRIPGYEFVNPLFRINIKTLGDNCDVSIYEGGVKFYYKKENSNVIIKERFLKFFMEQCEKEKIKIKKESD